MNRLNGTTQDARGKAEAEVEKGGRGGFRLRQAEGTAGCRPGARPQHRIEWSDAAHLPLDQPTAGLAVALADPDYIEASSPPST